MTFVDYSSSLLMEDEDDLASYYRLFLDLIEPLLFFLYVSKRESNELFWQGFHPDDRAMLSPYLVNKRANQWPGANLNFKELFNLAHAIFSDRRLAAEAARQRRLAWKEENRELKRLITNMHELSIDDPAYAVLYRQCARRFPDVAEGLPKPKALPEPVQDTMLQHDCHAPTAPSSLAQTPSPSPPYARRRYALRTW